jgi:hypothetical protein
VRRTARCDDRSRWAAAAAERRRRRGRRSERVRSAAENAARARNELYTPPDRAADDSDERGLVSEIGGGSCDGHRQPGFGARGPRGSRE